MRIVIVGAGGIGSYVGAALARIGHDVTFVARGAHAEAVIGEGLHVRTVAGDFRVHPSCVGSATELAHVDLAFIAVKAYSLDEVLPQVAHLAEAGATIVPLLNGVDATDRLAEAGVPADRLVEGVAYLTAFRVGPGLIERKGEHQRLVVGSRHGAGHGEMERVVRALDGSGIEAVIGDDIEVELWKKMAVVCALAAVCGITGSPIGPIRGHPFGERFQAQAIREVLDVGRARGVRIPPEVEADVNAILDGFPDDFYPSVSHDLRVGRRTEMEHLGGAISRFGHTAGVGTPIFDAATCAVQLTEARRVQTGATAE